MLRAIVAEAIETGVFSPDDVDRFAALMNALRHSDYSMVTVDFDAYFATQRSVEKLVAVDIRLDVLAETRSDRWCLVERSGFGVRRG
jgi:hypothetical protein